jgi:hypothetical protein
MGVGSAGSWEFKMKMIGEMKTDDLPVLPSFATIDALSFCL